MIDTPEGNSRRYRVQGSRIVDARTDRIRLADDEDELILVTCYPFEAGFTAGPLRYLVRAVPVPLPLLRSTDRPGGRESAGRGESTPPRRACPDDAGRQAVTRRLSL